jgi:hypothetical protein
VLIVLFQVKLTITTQPLIVLSVVKIMITSTQMQITV